LVLLWLTQTSDGQWQPRTRLTMINPVLNPDEMTVIGIIVFIDWPSYWRYWWWWPSWPVDWPCWYCYCGQLLTLTQYWWLLLIGDWLIVIIGYWLLLWLLYCDRQLMTQLILWLIIVTILYYYYCYCWMTQPMTPTDQPSQLTQWGQTQKTQYWQTMTANYWQPMTDRQKTQMTRQLKILKGQWAQAGYWWQYYWTVIDYWTDIVDNDGRTQIEDDRPNCYWPSWQWPSGQTDPASGEQLLLLTQWQWPMTQAQTDQWPSIGPNYYWCEWPSWWPNYWTQLLLKGQWPVTSWTRPVCDQALNPAHWLIVTNDQAQTWTVGPDGVDGVTQYYCYWYWCVTADSDPDPGSDPAQAMTQLLLLVSGRTGPVIGPSIDWPKPSGLTQTNPMNPEMIIIVWTDPGPTQLLVLTRQWQWPDWYWRYWWLLVVDWPGLVIVLVEGPRPIIIIVNYWRTHPDPDWRCYWPQAQPRPRPSQTQAIVVDGQTQPGRTQFIDPAQWRTLAQLIG